LAAADLGLAHAACHGGFQKSGVDVSPYPVDFQSGEATPWSQYSMAQGARKWKLALHEIFGLWAYQLSGKS
jgi:hypothetical protein